MLPTTRRSPTGRAKTMNRKRYLTTMVRQYAETALWSSHDYGEELDANYGVSDIDRKTMREFEEDCAAFLDSNATDLVEMDPGQAGHDFWLTRNGHGAGFWDRGLGELGTRLTKAAHVYGGVDLYVGDDGKVHGS